METKKVENNNCQLNLLKSLAIDESELEQSIVRATVAATTTTKPLGTNISHKLCKNFIVPRICIANDKYKQFMWCLSENKMFEHLRRRKLYQKRVHQGQIMQRHFRKMNIFSNYYQLKDLNLWKKFDTMKKSTGNIYYHNVGQLNSF